jgi:hypothetical protein
MKRNMMLVVALVGLMGGASFGGTRIVSVYIESLSSLQAQLFEAAQLFETPELGTAPMMINMMIPGAAQVDKNAPVAIHVFSGNDNDVAVVLSVKPANTAEMLLGAILMSQGATVPEAVDGRYISEQGAAQLHGDSLLIAKSTEHLDIALAVGVPSALPEVAGMLRIDAAPAKLVPMLDKFQSMTLQQMTDQPEQSQMIASVFELYRLGLGQIASYQEGIGVSSQGIEIRGKMVPQPGRALSRIIPTLQAVDASWVSELEGDDLFAVATGAYVVPEETFTSILDRYIELLQASSSVSGTDWDAEALRAMMKPSLATMGVPTFMTANFDKEDGLSLLGGMRMEDPSAYLSDMLELMKSDAYAKMMEQSGITVSEPTEREVNGNKVYRWGMNFDQDAFLKKMQQNGATNAVPADLAGFVKAMELFMPGYDYAATKDGLAFSSVDNADIEDAMKILAPREVASSSILAKIGAPVRPYMVGRFNFLAMVDVASKLGATPVVPEIGTDGEGIVLAGWRSGDSVEHLTLIPAADIRAIRKAMKTTSPSMAAPSPAEPEVQEEK